MADMGKTRIRVLDLATVNKIAAGEVIERPASVIKELVENSIDAGASRVMVTLESSRDGIRSIRVSDNGCGMSHEDARMAFTPHATSKISDITDLDRCLTLGFRGEALASIAAVSDVALVTMERDGETATVVHVKGGHIEDVTETGAPAGTTITVKDLFYNTPARKKFQRTLSSELVVITRIMEAFALSQPGVSFVFVHNGTERLSTEGSGDPGDTILSLYGKKTFDEMVPLSESGGPMRIEGYISRPSLSQRNNYQMMISINGRQVYARTLLDAIREGYGTLLPDSRYPVTFLDIRIDPAYVDVNVHPTKRVVRLSREKDLSMILSAAVAHVLARTDLIPGVPGMAGQGAANRASFTRTYDIPLPSGKGVAEPGHGARLRSDRQLRQTELPTVGYSAGEKALRLEFIGEFEGIYIIAKGGHGELLLIDQHAAHERILYDQVTELRVHSSGRQELLTPAILAFTPAESAALREYIPLLAEKGFVAEEFGRDSFAIRTVPVILGKTLDRETIREIIGELVSPGTKRLPDPGERLARTVACHGAVRAGTTLTPDQCRVLLEQLSRTNSPWTCPHGRPVMVALTRQRLDEMFKRT